MFEAIMFKSMGVLLIVFGVYEIAGSVLNFRGFGFSSGLKVKEVRAMFGNLGARIAFFIFGLATSGAGLACLKGYFGTP
ncbi:hypothetical protein OT109_02240 [Phycisphaeraceae bacterium D3-23]